MNLLIVFISTFSCGFASFASSSSRKELTVQHSWRNVDFLYPSTIARSAAVANGQYIPGNTVILDSEPWESQRGRRVFVSMPRFRSGIPATLGEISTQSRSNELLITPYPDWDSQSINTCDGPVSIYRIKLDSCGRLWVVDTGRINTWEDVRRVCQPKIIVYDLESDTVLLRYEFPEGVVIGTSNLVTIILDSRSNDCRDTVAYIADVNGFGLVVYDSVSNSSWRIEHSYFYPFPTQTRSSVAGYEFELRDGIFSMALGPIENNERLLYLHAFASLREVSVVTSVLKNYQTARADTITKAFALSDEVRDSQSTLEVMTDDGILIYNGIKNNALYCWHSKTPFNKDNVHLVIQNNDTLQFISGMKLTGDQLWVTSSRLQEYMAGRYNSSEIKIRLLSGSVRELLQNTGCESTSSTVSKQKTKKPSSATSQGQVFFPSSG